MKMIPHFIARRLGLASMVAVATFHGPVPAFAADVELILLGYRWEKPVVSCWVNAKPRVSAAAVADVLTALDDWNATLSEVPAAPVLAMASNRRNADILIELDVIAAGPGRSKPSLAGSGSSEIAGCRLISQRISIFGLVLAEPVGHPQTRNLARHWIGHALGLGHLACGGWADCDTHDVMDQGHIWPLLHYEDIPISPCDLAGLTAIYSAPTCEEIPASVDYTCE